MASVYEFYLTHRILSVFFPEDKLLIIKDYYDADDRTRSSMHIEVTNDVVEVSIVGNDDYECPQVFKGENKGTYKKSAFGISQMIDRYITSIKELEPDGFFHNQIDQSDIDGFINIIREEA